MEEATLAQRALEAHAKTLEKLEAAEEKIRELEKELLVLRSLDRIARIVRAAAYWMPEYRKQLVAELMRRYPDTKP